MIGHFISKVWPEMVPGTNNCIDDNLTNSVLQFLNVAAGGQQRPLMPNTLT